MSVSKVLPVQQQLPQQQQQKFYAQWWVKEKFEAACTKLHLIKYGNANLTVKLTVCAVNISNVNSGFCGLSKLPKLNMLKKIFK